MALAWKAGWVHALTSSNLVSSASLTRPFAPQSRKSPAARRPSGLNFGLSCFRFPTRGSSRGPEQPVDAVRHLTPDRVGDVLIAGGHRGAGPAHDAHHRPLGHAEDEEHSCRRVARVVKTAVRYAGTAEQCLPTVVVRVVVQGPARLGSEDPVAVLPHLAGRGP